MSLYSSERYSDAWRFPQRWAELCAQYLPIVSKGSFWRLSRFHNTADPGQGWKLHLSATLLSATTMLERVGPFLKSSGVLFKAPSILSEIGKINSGIYYGYTQIGKCLTIYPQSIEDGLDLACKLHELTTDLSGPVVPFDRRYRPGSCVYYRYGRFKRLSLASEDGTMRFADGRRVLDCRDSDGVELSGGKDPFESTFPANQAQGGDSPLKTTFRVFRALVQRGKGGVYKALDLSCSEPRLCVLKEGRRHGEVGWDGRDGFWRIRNEGRVLSGLSKLNVGAPRVYGQFEADENSYLAIEFIKGQTLDKLLSVRRRRLPMVRVVAYANQLATILSRLHLAGWVWRDCKPSNLMVSERGILRPIDFEGACRFGQQNPLPLGTPEFLPANYEESLGLPGNPTADLYALGVVIYYLLTGVLPSSPHPVPVKKLRENVPSKIIRILSGLIHSEPEKRTPAWIVEQKLMKISKELDLSSAQGERIGNLT